MEPVPQHRSTLQEFRDFAFKGNVIDLAIGVIIGGAFGKIVSGIVDWLIMPLIGLLLPGGHWREFTIHVGKAEVKIGSLLGTTLDFIIVAFVLFLLVRRLLHHQQQQAAAPAPTTPISRECPACFEPILKKARRCKHCTEEVTPEIEAEPAKTSSRAPAAS